MADDVLTAALEYALRGWHVFPVRGKVPVTSDGFKSASTDPERIASWWRQHPDAGVAIATGAVSGLVVLDEDTPKGGAGTLKTLANGGLPKTPEAITGGGGRHYFFAHPGVEVRSSAGTLGAGLDIRADGGYVVAPPSLHESGRAYKWARSPEKIPLAEPPEWLLAGGERRNGVAAAVGDTIPSGERDNTLASLAGSMRRRGQGEAEILAALHVTNKQRCKPPLPAATVERIARSVARYKPDTEQQDEGEEPFGLVVMTARELCALPDPPVSDEMLGPLLVRGNRLVVGGHTGEGKTEIAGQILRAVVNGEEFLGWRGPGGVRALVIDAEMGLKSIKKRLREMGLDESSAVDFVRVPDGLALDSDAQHVAAVERVLEQGDYGLVIVDPLYKLHTGDSNDERQATDLMRCFDAWRARYGFALALPVHCRKPIAGAKFTIHDIFGSSAYVRGAEVVVGIQRVREGYSRLYFFKDRDGDLPVGDRWGMLFDHEHGYRRDPEDGKREPTTGEQVRELLEETPWLTKRTLIEGQARVRAASTRR